MWASLPASYTILIKNTSNGAILPALTARLFCLCGGFGVEEPLEEEQLQVARQEDDRTLCCWPVAHVGGVGQEDVVVCALTHAGKVVVSPHVEDVTLQPYWTVLQGDTKECLKNIFNWLTLYIDML